MSELDLYAKYLDLGVKLGRSGEDLTTWVEDKMRQDIERSDRQIERERKREEMEMQKQREEKEMEMQRQREEIALQDRREERELKRLELEAETKKLEIGSRASVDVAGPKQSYGAQRPKIPPLHDPSQVDLYLEGFERHATAFGWSESEWASCLCNLLQDEALSIFLSLSPAEGSDYQAVKRVLLQRNYITSCHLCKSRPRAGRDRPAPFQHNQIRQSWRTARRSVCDSAEPTAYVSAISEEDGGEIGSLVTTPPLASENGTVVIDQSLSASQVQDVKELLLEFQDILTSVPGCTNTICHEIRLTTDDVIPFCCSRFCNPRRPIVFGSD
ncbi:reverse transcriptase [Plakobranchus ocellatus]|uniref:Reverse transcriptase n=1 Tax=Plakobranchus ocellatus TaxID=259542 RepID=A0AAV4APD5_9GAST|nr:reverse transcriptase [Plakobranchus ocellatus]